MKDHYLYSKPEIQNNLRILNLFDKFDADDSGALDAQELTTLYNQNGVMVTEDEIKKLYGNAPVIFTLQMFSEMTKDKERLRNYRHQLKNLKIRLLAEAQYTNSRDSIPSTFDSMMVDFGTKVERKESLSVLKSKADKVLNQRRTIDLPTVKSSVKESTDCFLKLLDDNNPTESRMSSIENELFRKIKDRAKKQSTMQQRLRERLMAMIRKKKKELEPQPQPTDSDSQKSEHPR